MRYTLELSEEQAEIIKIALEEYFRLRMNQSWDFADSLCFEDLKKNHTEEEFNKCIENRDMFRDELGKLLKKEHRIQFRGKKFHEQTKEKQKAQEIVKVTKH